jgi:DNA-binding CsgD family transcriptional regulator
VEVFDQMSHSLVVRNLQQPAVKAAVLLRDPEQVALGQARLHLVNNRAQLRDLVVGDIPRRIAGCQTLEDSPRLGSLNSLLLRDRPHPRPSAPILPELTDREREILTLIVQGHTNQNIANRLVLSLKTVQNHVSNIFNKLQVVDHTHAILRAGSRSGKRHIVGCGETFYTRMTNWCGYAEGRTATLRHYFLIVIVSVMISRESTDARALVLAVNV